MTDLEFVVDMFAGVGPFAIPVAKRALYVVAVDKNPAAYEYFAEEYPAEPCQEYRGRLHGRAGY